MIGLTGASGFVGRRVRRRLADRSVVTLGRSEADRPWDATGGPPDLTGITHLLHLASHLPSDYADPGAARACLEANALGTLTLLQQAAAQGVGHATVVSSGNVYRFDDDAPVVETAPTYPSERAAFYLGSKLLAEVWARHVASTTSLRVAVVRPSAIYGPGMRGGVVRVFVDRLRGGEPVQVQGGGAFASDLVYVDDVVDGLIAASQGEADGIFNLGSGRRTSTLELATTIAGLVGAPSGQVEVLGAPAPGGFAALDIGQARQVLGYRPTALRDGLRAMLEEEGRA